jgi:hypothetical protein
MYVKKCEVDTQKWVQSYNELKKFMMWTGTEPDPMNLEMRSDTFWTNSFIFQFLLSFVSRITLAHNLN